MTQETQPTQDEKAGVLLRRTQKKNKKYAAVYE